MPKNLFSSELRTVVTGISRLIYVNPFVEERIILEKEVLGADYRQEEQPWNLRVLESAGKSENLARLFAKAESLLREVQGMYVRQKQDLSGQSERHYQDLVAFVLFHRFIGEFDQVLQDELDHPQKRVEVTFWDRFERAFAGYLGAAAESWVADGRLAHLFALFYQVRRAFVFTHRFIVGTSRPAVTLRARVWQSVFTHDMERYYRLLDCRLEGFTSLITGPSGSGKELIARAIGFSRFIPFDRVRRVFAENYAGVFFPINLAALSPTLIESELFGHAKGSFTGAVTQHKGYFESCGSFGTVFLDELGETPLEIQVKLLRVLQSQQFSRLGETKLLGFTGKVIGATNRDLERARADGIFRDDLYFRLCGDRICSPSLREILDDKPSELGYLISFICGRIFRGKDTSALAGEIAETVQRQVAKDYPWNGNFRELEQCVRNVIIQGRYQPEAVSQVLASEFSFVNRHQVPPLKEMNARFIRAVYPLFNSCKEAAAQLGIDPRTVRAYLEHDSDPRA